MNQVTLIGRLGADPEIRTTQDGRKLANMRVATTERWKDKNGERREKTEWHSICIYSEGLAGIAERFLRKGSQCLLQGKLATRKWQDKQGQDRYSTEVVLQGFDAKLVLLDGKDRSDSDDRHDSQAPANSGSASTYEPGSVEEDFIPF